MNGLDLFAGIGGIAVALEPWVRPRAYCEIDRYAQAVLLSRMADGSIPSAPIWDDVRSLTADMLPPIDIIYGGFPCTDISVAGRGAGLAGEHSGLFFEVARLVSEIRPSFVFLENVPAIRSRGADVVVGRLAELGYDCRWGVLSAFDVGAPHLRERWWLLAKLSNPSNNRQRLEVQQEPERWRLTQTYAGSDGEVRPMADANLTRLEVGQPRDAGQCSSPFGKSWWLAEPDVDRVVVGLPYRVDRIKCLGNSVVPACAREAFRRLSGL